mmetsp:Transcript_22637/g.46949  ORF Transcript_22637/g.46949 Transcript_22637/m.46949 type:complete len:926 (+) Transcript_22637:129-2906(+)
MTNADPSSSVEGIRVAVRVRPFLPQELGSSSCVDVNGPANQISIGHSDKSSRNLTENGGRGKPKKSFTFDHALSGSTPQHAVYDSCVSALVASCLEGYNATALAYGQTGAGKSYTILGPSAASAVGIDDEVSREVGIIPRALGDLFAALEKSKASSAASESAASFDYNVKLQFLELYGEEIRDLLAATRVPGTKPAKLMIRDTKADCEVLGATSVHVKSAEDALLCLTRGMLRRVTGATAMNAESSRSHAIMTVLIEQTQHQDGGEKTVITSKFNFVDLAGSERAKRTGAKGTRLKEGIDINKGLLVLGNVISALAAIDPNKPKSGKFVPFRDSKLTRILRGSLGGNHKTLLFVCVSPSSKNLDESLNALRYANRAKNIKNAATKHVEDSGSAKLIAELKGQVGALAAELLRIRNGGDPTSGKAFSLDALQQLSKGHSAVVENGAARPSNALLLPPQDSTKEGGETRDSFSTCKGNAVTEDASKLREALNSAESNLVTTEEKLLEMTRERDELLKRLDDNGAADAAGTATTATTNTMLKEDALVSIVERIIFYQREMEEEMSLEEWSDEDDDQSSITFDENDNVASFGGELIRRGPRRGNEDTHALDVASGLYSTGLFLVESQSYQDSLPCFQVALEIRREQFGWDDAGVGDVLYMEGLVRACIRDHDRALILLYDALRIRKNLADDRNIAATLRTIGDLHVSKKEYQLADMFYEECLHSAMECNDSSLTDIWLSLAKVKKKIGQRQEALDCVEEILAAWRSSFGSKDRQDWGFGQDGALRRNISMEESMMAPTLYEIGVLAFQLNDGTRGHEALVEFITIREAQGTDINDVKVANACYTLGNHCSAKKETDAAQTYWSRALKIYMFLGLPEDHPHIVSLKELTQSAPRNRLLSGIQNAFSTLTTDAEGGTNIKVVSEAQIQDLK